MPRSDDVTRRRWSCRRPFIDRLSAVSLVTCLLLASLGAAAGQAQEGRIALEGFDAWRNQPQHAALGWDESLRRYREHLMRQGRSAEEADRAIRLAVAHDEGTHYDKTYAGLPEFQTAPTRLLVDAVDGLTPGRALDVGMGQGRNALFLAQRGWTVTGFDVSTVGLAKASTAAAAHGLSLDAVHASDEEFDFGRERWDLIAILYALEKRSVFRVKEALRPGGLVVVEGAHRDASGGDWEFESNELLRIFEGFTILKYEDLVGAYDWAPGKPVRMVRLVARKPT
jgi:SAM-dependent methyltransferase